jgi:hypothetical protein
LLLNNNLKPIYFKYIQNKNIKEFVYAIKKDIQNSSIKNIKKVIQKNLI